jgi:hypothetical protein
MAPQIPETFENLIVQHQQQELIFEISEGHVF